MDHPNKGRKQSPEHIAKRVAAWKLSTAPKNSRFKTLNKERIGKPHSEETKKKIAASTKGMRNALGFKRDEKFRRKLAEYWAANREKHNHYMDGKGWERTNLRTADMQRIDYRLWREAVFERDNWTCVQCGERDGDHHADHIKPYALYPDLRYDLDNGRTLCVPCHKKTPTYGGRRRRPTLAVAGTFFGFGLKKVAFAGSVFSRPRF